MKFCILACLIPVVFIGCATGAELVCGPVDTEIISDPVGAKIEVDGKYVGTTPLTATLSRKCDWYNYTGAQNPITIKAEPVNSGQVTQYKIIDKSSIIPRRIIFYMYQPSAKP